MSRQGNKHRTWLLLLLSLLFLGIIFSVLYLTTRPDPAPVKTLDKSRDTTPISIPPETASDPISPDPDPENQPIFIEDDPHLIDPSATTNKGSDLDNTEHEIDTKDQTRDEDQVLVVPVPEASIASRKQTTDDIKQPQQDQPGQDSHVDADNILETANVLPTSMVATDFDDMSDFDEVDNYDAANTLNEPASLVSVNDLDESEDFDVEDAYEEEIAGLSVADGPDSPELPAVPASLPSSEQPAASVKSSDTATAQPLPDMVAEDETVAEDGIQEGYVGIRVNKTRGSSFYKVMINEEEDPFLDINDALKTWLDLSPDCDMGRKYCQTIMPGTNTIYWLDAEALQMGDSKGNTVNLPADAIVERNSRLWLRHDWWSKWLPMSTNWSLNSYILGFYPNFPLLAEIKQNRIKSRKTMYAQQEQRKEAEKIPPMLPQESIAIQGRYRLQYNRSEDGTADLLTDFDVLLDALGGTFLSGGHYNSAISKTNLVTDNTGTMDYWRYTFKRKEHFNLLEFGDTWHKATLLVPSVFVSDGLQLNRLESKHSAGEFEVSDRTQPGTEIDVYLNGFLLRTIVVGQDGFYSVEEQYVSGGDIINLRFYYPDGSENEQTIRIAPDNAQLLPAGEWDTRIISGETGNGQFSHVGLRLGSGYNSSIGVHGYGVPLSTGVTEQAVGIDFAWRPHSSLGVTAEFLSFENGDDHTIRADFTGLSHNAFQIEHQSVHTNSPLYELASTQIRDVDLWKLRHLFRYSGWSWRGEYFNTADRDIFNSSLNVRFDQQYSAYVETQDEWKDNQHQVDFKKVGATYSPDKLTVLDFSQAWTPQNTTWTGNYRIQRGGKTTKRWDLNITASYSDGTSTASLGALWRLSRNFSMGFSANQNDVVMRVVWTDILTTDPGPRYWDEFSTGTLAGSLSMPATDEHPAQPIKGAIVRADNKWVRTGADGEYVITGLATDQRVSVKVDNTTLDASVIPEKELEVAYFRPGTRIIYDPKITWTIGIDGYVVHSVPIPEEAVVQIVRREDNKLMKTVSVESDGFFLAEGLSNGNYKLYLSGVEQPPEPMSLDIPAGQDWLSDIKLHWR